MPKRRKQSRNPEQVLQDAEITAQINPTLKNRRALRTARAVYAERVAPAVLVEVA